VDGKYVFDGFKFEQKAVFDEQIETQRLLASVALVVDKHDTLVAMADHAEIEFLGEAPLVDGFYEAWTLVAMHFDGRADDRIRKVPSFGEERMHAVRLAVRQGFYSR
jgi:hypothetical protein